jgi:hypothetical protein
VGNGEGISSTIKVIDYFESPSLKPNETTKTKDYKLRILDPTGLCALAIIQIGLRAVQKEEKTETYQYSIVFYEI